MEPDLLCESPVTDVALQGPEQVFDDVKSSRLFEVIEALERFPTKWMPVRRKKAR